MKKNNFLLLSFILIIIFPFSISAEQFKKAPDFYLWGPNSNIVVLSKLKGNVVLINFWGTWLIKKWDKNKKLQKPTGNEEILRLDNLKNYYNNKKVKLALICVDVMPTNKFKKFTETFFNLSPPPKKGSNDEQNLYILLSNSGAVEKDFGGITVIPTTFIIDKKGFIRYKFSGEQNTDIYKNAINALLKEK